MNSFIRQVYRRSGSRSEGVIVPFFHSVPKDGVSVRRLMALLWVIFVVVLCRHTTVSEGVKDTVIDTSKLVDLTMPSIPEMPEYSHKKRVEKRQQSPSQVVEAQGKTVAGTEPPPPPPPEELKPQILAPPLPKPTVEPPGQKRSRDRIFVDSHTASTPTARIVREAPSETESTEIPRQRYRKSQLFSRPAEPAKIQREQRGERVEVPDETSLLSRKQRDIRGPEPRESGTAKKRREPPQSVDRAYISERGNVRMVSYESLDVCPNPSDKEEAIRKVLKVMGARTSCGEYQFTGTSRISSFHMDIEERHRLSNQCEELNYAFKCLTQNH